MTARKMLLETCAVVEMGRDRLVGHADKPTAD